MLLHHSGGLRRAEIARRLGVHRSTVSRDIDELSSYLPIIEDDDGILRIDKRGYLTSVSLTMFELEALHLSARLFSREMKFPFPHAAAALRKLAEAQGRVSDMLAARIRDSADEIELSASGFSKSQVRYRVIIEKLGLAISEMRPITAYHKLQNNAPQLS
jgi:predicted DNA-binding transcriptional regulator YafY